ncbi:hypothetical protein CLOSCI_01309 [[Clostridium] scindens ATCC 35704]|nr:hypothetical protein CLOSCI_01309 [[Clostridium] scindens ATCC 35704]
MGLSPLHTSFLPYNIWKSLYLVWAYFIKPILVTYIFTTLF